MSSQTAAPPAAEPTCRIHPDASAGFPSPDKGTGEAGPRRSRRVRKAAAPHPWTTTILARLEQPECLLCREGADGHRRHYFWFLNESYGSVPTVERLQRARGFCLRHTRHLLAYELPDRVCVVAGYVLAACDEWLQGVLEGGASGGRGQARQSEWRHPITPCPACEDIGDGVRRYAWALAECLQETDVAASYRRSAGLCFPHFLETAHLARWEALTCLVAEQIRRMEDARAAVTASGGPNADGSGLTSLREGWRRLYGQDLDHRIRPYLTGPCGHGESPMVHDEDTGSPGGVSAACWSPAFEETCRLLRQPGCSLCRVAARGRENYLAWLGQEIRECASIPYRWEHIQFLCGEHAWLVADRCAPEVLGIACEHLLARTVGELRRLHEAIREPIPSTWTGRMRALPARWRESSQAESARGAALPRIRRLRRTVRTLWRTPRQCLDAALARTLWRGGCPLCEHLGTVVRRAADRLVAVLGDPIGRRAFDRSYGVCLGHAPLLLERAHDPKVRAHLVGVLRARVAVDAWETAEFLRKQSWSVRHEPRGAEGTAWLRVSARYAGMVQEGDDDVWGETERGRDRAAPHAQRDAAAGGAGPR